MSLCLTADGRKRFQTVDGFGVNLNSKYWNGGKLEPALKTLVDDLGARLFRLDAWGRSDWPDPDGRLGARRALAVANLARVYSRQEFSDAGAVGRWLNARGIKPYVTLSGILPRWMCGPDGRTIRDFKAFAVMAASYAKWLRHRAGVRFSLFGPMNETDIGPPEGPKANPRQYALACAALSAQLSRVGLADVRLVAAEQAGYSLDYVRALAQSPAAPRIAVFSLHRYSDRPMGSVVPFLRKSSLSGARLWMTEFGDLDQTGEKEWTVAWVSFSRLLRLLREGYQAAIFWDAFDNHHDHDSCWTIYGLLRPGNYSLFTPKKRYWALRHIFRYVRPGWTRIAAAASPSVPVVAFSAPGGNNLTVAGMNMGNRPARLRILGPALENLPARARMCLSVTTEKTYFRTAGTGLSLLLPPRCLFTASTLPR